MAVQDPSISGVPGRYATALYELASDEKAVDEVGKNLKSIGEMMDGSEDLVRLVRSPVFGSDEQWAALSAVLKKAKIGGLTFNFVGLVAKNRRLFVLRDMIRAYGKLVAHAKGEVSAEVTSAEKLSAAVVGQVEKLILRGILRPGERLPAERELAERLGVSRPSLREAIAELQSRGLLTARANAGVFVSDVLGSMSDVDPALNVVAGVT